MRDKRVTGNSQDRFTKGKLCLTDLRVCYDETTALMEKVKAAEASADF